MSYSMSRPYTTKLLDMMSDGLIIPEQVAQMCLSYMSEDDVKDMMLSNDVLTENDEDFNDSKVPNAQARAWCNSWGS